MATVDNKVVSLEFNNSRFTGNVQSTMSALDRLKEKLSFKGGTKGFEDIQAAANQVKVDNISRGIEGVSKGFIALSTVAVTALSQITSAAMSSGAQVAKSFTFKPVMDGFGEYSMNIGAIQTILANTDRYGTKLPEVTANLDELNEYSDKTIYNFGEMVKNIGLFTNAGIKIEDATSMIKGFSNVAAASGTTAEGAAGAAYQLSQALSAGEIRLMDWKSLTNVGMGNKNMQEGIIKIADSMGELEKAETSAAEVSDNFNASLEKKWLSADVMSNYLRIMAGDMDYAAMAEMGLSSEQIKWFERQQKIAEESATKVRTFSQLMGTVKESIGSGWSETFRTVVGDFDQATELFTNLNNYFGGMIGASQNARNLILKDWEQRGGRDTFLQGMLYAWEDILSVLRPIKDAFREVFPKKTSDDLINMTNGFRDFFKNFKIGEGVISAIKGVFTVFFSVIKTGFKIVTFLGGALFKLVGAIGSFIGAVAEAGGGAIKSFFSAIGDLFKTLTGGAGEAASGALDGISSGAQKLGTWLGNLIGNLEGITEKIKDFTKNLQEGDKATGSAEKSTSRFAGVIEWFKNVFTGIKDFFSGLFDGISSFGELIGNIFGKIGDGLSSIGSNLSNAFGDINWNTVIGGVGVGAGVVLVKRIKDFLDGVDIDDLLQELGQSLRGVLDSAAGAFDAFTNRMEDKAGQLRSIAISIGILTAALVILASLDPKKLAMAGAAMAAMFVALQQAAKSLTAIEGQLGTAALSLVGLAAAMLLLAIAMNMMKELDDGDIAAGVLAITVLLGGMASAASMMKEADGDLARAGLTMIGMAAAIYILSFALKKMTELDPARALAGTVAAVAAIVGMTEALKRIDEKSAKAKGFAFLSVGLAVNLFAMAVEKFGNMPLDKLGTGMAAIAAIFTGLIFFFKKLPPNMAQVATEILIISVALNVLAYAIEAMGSMEWDTLKQGLMGIAGALVIMAIAAQIMNSAIVGAGAIVIMAVGLTLLAGAVATFGQMGVDTMIKSILGIAAVLVVIAAAGALMGAISPLLLAGGIAFLVLGAGMLLFGAGAWLAASAILALTGASGAGVAAAIVAMKLLAAAIPGFIEAFAMGFIEGTKEVLDAIPELMQSADEAIYSVVTTLVGTVTRAIRTNIDDIVQAGFDILLAMLRGIRDNIGELTMTTAEIIVEFVNGLAAAIEEKSQEIGDAGRRLAKAMVDGIINVFLPESVQEAIGDMVTGMIDFFKEKLGIASPSQVFMDLAGDIIAGLVNGLVSGAAAVLDFFTKLPGRILESLGDLLGTLLGKGKDLLGGLWNGAKNIWESVKTWVSGLAEKARNAIGDISSKLLQKGKDLINGIKSGAETAWSNLKSYVSGIPQKIYDAVGNIRDKVRDLGRNVVEGIKSGISRAWSSFTEWIKEKIGSIPVIGGIALRSASPAKVMIPLGEYTVQGLQVGMSKQFPKLYADVKSGTAKIGETMQSALNAIPELSDINPSITPVLDLSNVEAKAATLGDILGIDSLTTDLSYINAQAIATTAKETDSTDSVAGGDTYLNFVQNNNSPKALSTGDIYRGHKSQIALARKELGLVG